MPITIPKPDTDYLAGPYESALRPRPAPVRTISTGGQGTRRLLTSTLEEGRRRARLTGRQLTAAEVKGMTGGYFGQATERLTARKALGLQERGQEVTMRGQDITERMGLGTIAATERGQDITREIGLGGIASQETMQERGFGQETAMLAADRQLAVKLHGEDIGLAYVQMSPDDRITFDRWLKGMGYEGSPTTGETQPSGGYGGLPTAEDVQPGGGGITYPSNIPHSQRLGVGFEEWQAMGSPVPPGYEVPYPLNLRNKGVWARYKAWQSEPTME